MSTTRKTPFAVRSLTPREREVGIWLISHGTASDEEKAKFLAQLSKASVIGKCECGCASIDLAIEGHPIPKGGLRILGDFVRGENQDGIFVFEKEGILAGIEIFQIASDVPCSELPAPTEIHDYGT